jgi:tRNA 2-thiouridine synthesizing protein A
MILSFTTPCRFDRRKRRIHMAMSDEGLKNLKVDKVVDARGTACPGPLLEAKRSMAQVQVGGTMEVLSSDVSTKKDIPLWANKMGHEFLGTLEGPSYWRIFVRRGK